MRPRSSRLAGTALAAVLTVLLLDAGCGRDPQQDSFVARVGRAVLTEEDLAAMQDSAYAGRERTAELINGWVTRQLLLQEATRRGVMDSEGFRAQLETAKRQLGVQALLEEEIYGAEVPVVPEDSVAAYFRAHQEIFLLYEDVVNVSYALFDERDAANTFRSQVLRGVAWTEALARVQKDSLLRAHLLQTATRQYFTRATLFPEELWKLARTLNKDEVSFVVKTDAGYYVLTPHGVKRRGEIPDLQYVRDEIRHRMMMDERQRKYSQFLARLREQYPVEIRMPDPVRSGEVHDH